MHAPRFKTGKTPATEDPRDLKFSRYLTALPPIPTGVLGHAGEFADDAWLMFANDSYGDCVFAGAAHETVLWCKLGGSSAVFNDTDVLSDYSAVTGFDPGNPSTDQGTDMRQAMLYRKNTGVIDANGKRHKIGAFVRIDSIDELKRSIYLFGVAAIGFIFPESAWDQFDRGQPWDLVDGAPEDGGHYVPLIGYDSRTDLFTCVTWGREQQITPRFLARLMDEAYAPLSSEMLRNDRSPEGFDLATLQNDLAHIGDPVPEPTPAPSPSPSPSPNLDLTLWQATRAWAYANHVRDNKAAATAVKTWAKAKGLIA